MVAIELRRSLAPAYRCAAFDGVCKSMRYEPQLGLFPRGYAGATGRLHDVDLVVCVAEPGEPSANAKPQPEGAQEDSVEEIASRVEAAFSNRKGLFHRNVMTMLDGCWPGLTFEEMMRRTWITEGVLCSAEKTTGPVPTAVTKECVSRYLTKQLELLPKAFVIALGGKAKRRLTMAGRPPDVAAFAAGLPGCNHKGARPSWQGAGDAFRAHLRQARASDA